MNINPEVFGFIAGGISSALFIPQIIKIFKEKSAEEISLLTCIIGIISSVLWLYYGVVKDSISMMVTNSIFFSVKLKNNHRIHFSGVGSTMMYCDGNMKLEENFGKLLPTITKYQVKGHFLTLKNKNGQTMKFVAEDWD